MTTYRRPYRNNYSYTFGPLWKGLGVLAAAALFLGWPALIWHSLIACCAWWGVLMFIMVLKAADAMWPLPSQPADLPVDVDDGGIDRFRFPDDFPAPPGVL